jgi:hypothetical protein
VKEVIPVYQPVISDKNIRRLYQLKLKERRPMTKIINQIIKDFFIAYTRGNPIAKDGKELESCGMNQP